MIRKKQAERKKINQERHIKKWKESGLSQAEYCSMHKISKSTFGYWIKKQSGEIKNRDSGFFEVPVTITNPIDIGKSCIRFKKESDITYNLIKKLVKKITVDEWITMYEKGHMKK